MTTLEYSVVRVTGTQRERAGHALAPLLEQAGIECAETLLLDRAEGFSDPPGRDHPAVRLTRIPNSTLSTEARTKFRPAEGLR